MKEADAKGIAVKRHRIGYTLWPANFDLVEPGSFLDEAEQLGVDTVYEVQLYYDSGPHGMSVPFWCFHQMPVE